MGILIILHIIIIIFLVLLGVLVYKKYKKYSGSFFLISSLLMSIWYFLYLLVFSTSLEQETILLGIKILYALSISGYYSMLFFIYYFNTKKSHIPYSFIYTFFTLLGISIVGTDFYISGVKFLPENGYYYEVFGPGYHLLVAIYALFLPLFGYISYKRFSQLSTINKIRIKYISISFFIYTFITFLALILMPLLGEITLVQYIIFLIVPFVLGSYYAIHNYNFVDLQIKTGSILVNILALAQTFMILYFMKYYAGNLGKSFSLLWGLGQSNGFGDFILGLVIFLPTRTFLTKLFLGNTKNQKLGLQINYLKKHIPYITNLSDLNTYIKSEFNHLFKIKYVHIESITTNEMKSGELCTYFKEDNCYFMNDFVFIQENKHKFNEMKIFHELNAESYFIFPIKNNNNEVVGLFSIGKKPFKEQYTKDEVIIFEELKIFLEGHFKYIEIYKKIHDLSVNLDKKIDEQTIEYNQLINKQKEFISYVSHEVKGPIASSIFQIDSIIEEVIDDELSKKNLLKELHILNELLLKTGDLVNKLFSIQQFELNSNSLFKERVHLLNLLKHEISLFKKIHPSITFITDFDESLNYIELDKVQFKQVIDNLINNAIKIISPQNGEIFISCKLKKQDIIIEIEDNGKGFTNLDIKKIFDKYTTGKGSSVGLGMGLYLCKTIVELHGGNIQAAFGKRLGGAKIIIKIPLI